MSAPQIKARQMPKWFVNLLVWREKNISENNFVMILALVVGVCAGLAAMILKWLIHNIGNLLLNNIGNGYMHINWAFILYPSIGVIIVVLYVKYFVKDNISHGVTRVLYAISQKKSRLKLHNVYTSIVASSVTIGFGGSVGAEGPIVSTGAAIGSNFGSLFRLSPRILMILVGCGAAAGISGIFKAPIAGMLFTLEVLMIDFNTLTVMPLLIASITGATISYIYTGYDFEFFFIQSEDFHIGRVPHVIILGIVCGLVSLYFTRVMNMMESFFGHFKKQWHRTAVGCLILSTLVFIFPPLYGEGYSSINMLLAGNVEGIITTSPFAAEGHNVWMIITFIALIIAFKAFATSATNGAGGVGGTFAPSLYVGCLTGFLFAFLAEYLDLGMGISTKNFALIGMAGVMAGVMHAPLMAIFLTAELTGGYYLFLPLLIVSTISYGTIKIFEPYSIYTMRLARKGQLITHHKDKAVLTLLKVDNVIETNFLSVTPDMNLKQMVDVISKSNRNLFPVLDENGYLIGIVLLDEIRNIMFRPDLYRKMTVSTFMSIPPAKIDVSYNMDKVMKTFDETGAWNLPVVDKGKYVGFVSKSKIFNSYRRVLRHYCED